MSDPYETFCATVALEQLTQWLFQEQPVERPRHAPALVLDVSRALPDAPARQWDDRVNEVVTSAGHRSLVVARQPSDIDLGPYKQPMVVADPRNLDWVRPESVDMVIAEGAALSDCLAAEDTVIDLARILRPGGRLLASTVSLTSGLSQLAEQNRWPELADSPAADVMLVPDPYLSGSYLRCFGPDELHELLSGAGLEVDWVRSRTMLPAAAVRQTLASHPEAMTDLVANELSLAAAHEGESHGGQLIVSGRRAA